MALFQANGGAKIKTHTFSNQSISTTGALDLDITYYDGMCPIFLKTTEGAPTFNFFKGSNGNLYARLTTVSGGQIVPLTTGTYSGTVYYID